MVLREILSSPRLANCPVRTFASACDGDSNPTSKPVDQELKLLLFSLVYAPTDT